MRIGYVLRKSLSKNVWNITAIMTIFNKSFPAGILRGRETKWWLNYPFISKSDLSESGLRHCEEMGLGAFIFLLSWFPLFSEEPTSQISTLWMRFHRVEVENGQWLDEAVSVQGSGSQTPTKLPLQKCWRCRNAPVSKPKWIPPVWHGYRARKPGVAQLNQQVSNGSAPSYQVPKHVCATRQRMSALPALSLLAFFTSRGRGRRGSCNRDMI